MAYLIENNNFSNDSYGIRATRLNFLAANIDTYAVELSLEGSLLEWAQDASDLFDAALVKQNVEIGEMDEAFQTSQEAVQSLVERYQILKDILISRYSVDDQKLNIFGIKGQTPRNQTGIVSVSRNLVAGNDKLKLAGDPNVLPDSMITNFQALIDDAENKYLNATMERQEALDATNELRVLYEQGSINLRAIYNWTIATWSKYDSRLIVLGYAQASERGGGRVPAIPVNLAYNETTKVFSWDEVTDATSYQLAYCLDGQPEQEWMSDYSGTDNFTVFEPGDGNWLVKVRARSANGYSDWSNTLTVLVESGLPAPGYMSLNITNSTTKTIAINWGDVTGATVYRLFHSAVAIGDSAGPYVLFGEYTGTSYLGVVSSPNRHYFYVEAANETETSPPSTEGFLDVL